MKHMKHWLMMAVVLSYCIVTKAHDFEVDGIYYNITSSSNFTVEVTLGSNEYGGAVTIPSTVTYGGKTYSVTNIGVTAFDNCTGLTSITIPESVTSIEDYAFYNCINLTSITLPESVTSIGEHAFCDCSSLTSIIIPESVMSIGFGAFYGTAWYDNLPDGAIYAGKVLYEYKGAMPVNTNIEVEEGTVSINTYAFYNCINLTSITLPESVTSIGEHAFDGCSSLTYITLPDGVTGIGRDAFYGCISLTSITLPESLTSIENNVFYNCINLTSITLPENVTSIGESAFYDCSSLTSITLPENLTSIGGNAFYGTTWYNNQSDGVVYAGKVLYKYKGTMSANTNIEVEKGTISISPSAFWGCSNLTSITLPESVTSIGEHAFCDCSSLTSIIIPESVISIGVGAFYGTAWYDNLPDGVIYAGKVLYEYKGTMPANTNIAVKEGTVSINTQVFTSCIGLTSITLPESLTSIGYAAFYDCSSLTEIYCYLREPIEFYDLFFGCSIENVYVPDDCVGLYQKAEGWKDCNIMPILTRTQLVVNLPNDVSDVSYKDMYIELVGANGDLINKYLIGEQQSYTFYNLIGNKTYNIFLKNKMGCVLGFIADIHLENSGNEVTFNSLLKPQDVIMTVLTPDGTDVTESAIVIWYATDGNYLCKDAVLSGQVEDTEVKYSVKLSKELAMQYKQPEQTTYTVKSLDNEVKVVLEPFSTTEITGTVRDSVTGTPVRDAMATFSQKLNGGHVHVTRAETDSKGAFKATLYDVPAEVTVAAADYISYTLSLDTLTEATTLGEILMKPISGVVVSVGFTYRTSVPDGDTPEILGWYTDYDNVKYGILNKTTGLPVSNFSVQYPQFVLLDGVSAGDELLLTVVSRTSSFEPTQTTAVVDSTLQCDATFDIVELGGIEASYTTTTNSAVVGILYNEIGEMVQKRSYSSGSLTLDNLRDGSYTLVTMGSSDYFNAIYNLAQLSAVGLVEGADYVKHAVKVESGVVSVVEMESVPAFDESMLYYTGGDTRFTVDKTSATAGNYLTLTGKIDFKEEYTSKVSGVSMVIDIPESAVFVDNSVMIGAAVAAYTLEDNRLTISLPGNYTERVRFCIIPTESGSYAPTAFAQFSVDSKEVLQPIGSAHYTIKDLSINIPATVAKTTIPVSGTAIGQSIVQIYDNDVQIGETTSLANGVWSVVCELHEPYNLSKHRIHAKVISELGMELTSETKVCMFDMNAIVVDKVTMYYDSYVNEFDFQTPSNNSQSYAYSSNTAFTFTLEFNQNDTTKISNVVLYVKNMEDEWTALYPEYDEDKCLWVTSAKSSELGDSYPVSVSVDYNYKTEFVVDRKLLDLNFETINRLVFESTEKRKGIYNDYYAIVDTDSLFVEIDKYLANDSIGSGLDGLMILLDNVHVVSDSFIPEDVSFSELETRVAMLEDECDSLINKEGVADFFELVDNLYGDIDLNSMNSFSESVSINNAIKNVLITDCSSVIVDSLVDNGYLSYYLTDGSVIYYKMDGWGFDILDISKNKRYKMEIIDNIQQLTRGRINEDFMGYVSCGEQVVSIINNLKPVFDEIGDGRTRWMYVIRSLSEAIQFMQCYYQGYRDALVHNFTQSCNKLSAKYDEPIKKSQKDLDNLIYKLSKQEDEFNALRLRQHQLIAQRSEIESNSNLTLEQKKSQLKSLEKELDDIVNRKSVLYDERVRTNGLLKKAKSCHANLEKNRKLINSMADDFNKAIEKLPVQLNKGITPPKWLRISGKLAGDFGIMIQTISLYLDIVEMIDEHNKWLDLADAIDSKIPCEGSPIKAANLKDRIYNDVNGNLRNNLSLISGEVAAIVFSAAGGVPVVSPTWWAEQLINIACEIGKIENTNASVHLIALYWVEVAQLKCSPDKKTNNVGKYKPQTPDLTPIIDPSGYVYEGVSSNRLDGVMASCYYKEKVEDIYGDQHENVVLWDAEEYAQENPLFTDANGMYRWDVPKGLWQVKFEKEGYETTFSEWLPVPPPQLEVNIPMVQNKQPEVAGVHAYKDGVEIEFDKYMQPATLNTDNIFVTQNGEKVAGTVTLLNEEVVYEGKSETYASKVRFVFDQAITAKEITLTVVNSVKSYAGLQMQDTYTQTFAIEQEVEGIVADSLVSMYYGGEQTLTVKVIPAAAAAGKTLAVTSSSPMILGVDTDSIVLDDSGEAVLTVSGELPGMGAISYSLVGYDYRASTLVEVVYNNTKMTANPTASIASGTTVKKGTEVTLSCTTEGATIYYTLDGSCPCDDTAILYDGTPIVINENTELRIMAVAEGMYESDVVVYNYYVEGADVEEVTLPFAIDPTVVTDGFRVQGIETECTVAVYGVGGELVMQREHVKNNTFINIAHVPEGMYIVVVSKDDDTHKQRILKVK